MPPFGLIEKDAVFLGEYCQIDPACGRKVFRCIGECIMWDEGQQDTVLVQVLYDRCEARHVHRESSPFPWRCVETGCAFREYEEGRLSRAAFDMQIQQIVRKQHAVWVV